MNPWEDKDIIEAFIDAEWQSVVDWCDNKNLNPNSFENQFEYCNFYDDDFLEFAAEYEVDYLSSEADRSNDLNEDN